MQPSYVKPGNRSAVGSGIDESALPKLDKPLGEHTPAGFNKVPKGATSVQGLQGASTPATADGKAASQFQMK
ncbi:MAG TPA: hypothetical protein VM869_00470 [Enhygromyxa sp.]|nr:hypothetical protein [Enhygromyxa sp.]